MKQIIRVSFVILCILLTVSLVSAQTQQPQKLTVLTVDGAGFPENIAFTVRVQDASGQAVSGLGADNFAVSETTTAPLSVLESEGAMSTVFIFHSQANDVREQALYEDIVIEYGNIAHNPNDTLAYIFTASDNVVPATTTSDLVTALDRHSFSTAGKGDSITNAISRAMSYLQPAYQANEQVQVILIGSYIAGDVSNSNTDIPLHVFHAHSGTRSQYESAFRNLASGQFLSIQGSSSELTDFLSNLDKNHIVYNVSYSTSTAQEGLRSVNVTATANGGTATGILNYQADTLAPIVEIIDSESSDFNIERTVDIIATPSATTDEQRQFNKNTETITVQVSFPDGRTRSINQAYLVVDGVQQPNETPAMNGDTFTITWDLTEYESNSTVSIEVGVVDYFNLQSKSSTKSYAITVPENVTPIVEVNPCLNPDGTTKNTAECAVASNANTTLVLGGVLLVVLIALVGIVVWQYRRIGDLARGGFERVTNVAHNVAEIGRKTSIAIASTFGRTTTVEGDEEDNAAFPTYGGHQGRETQVEPTGVGGETVIEGFSAVPMSIPNDALAMFIVEKGQAIHGDTILMHESKNRITFGRVEDFGVDSEGLISDAMEGVGRIHCTVSYNDFNRSFTIEDKDTKNGTFLDGQKMPRNGTMPLRTGMSIRLGKSFSMLFISHPQLETDTHEQNHPAPVGGKPTMVEPVALIDDTEFNLKRANPDLFEHPNGGDVHQPPQPPPPSVDDNDDDWLD